MTLIDDLFLHNNVDNLPLILNDIKKNKPVHNLYCIVFHTSLQKIELFSTNVLFSKRNLRIYEKDALIIGLAYSKIYGIQLIKYIAQDCIDSNKDINIKEQWF